MTAPGEPTGFLYPFLGEDEPDAAALLADLAASARSKAAESAALCRSVLAAEAGAIDEAAREMAARFARGGRLFTFGNGGSATDAALLAELFADPPWGRPLPALSLTADAAVITALGNDVGFELVFSRQLIAGASAGDMAVGLSTSGSSDNVLTAFAEGRRLGLFTLGLAGSDGGRMASCGDIALCLVVPSVSIHRIQEAEDAVMVELWTKVQHHLGQGATAAS